MVLSAVIFPGQGAQSVGMGRDAYTGSERGRSVFDRADRILGFPLSRICFEGPNDKLEQTDIQQPAIFVTSVALWEAFLEKGGSHELFARWGGLSLGEYTALHLAGAMSFDDALRLVRRRGELMQRAAASVPSGMVSLVGADEATAVALCEKAREQEVLVPANFNCPGQIVISGSRGACDRAVGLAESFSCRALRLAVAGAFHSPIMEPAADGLRAVLADTSITAPFASVISNVDAEYHRDAASIRAMLEKQLTHAVRWQRCIERMIADGTVRFVEFGPGRALTGLLRKINRDVEAVNVSSVEALANVIPKD